MYIWPTYLRNDYSMVRQAYIILGMPGAGKDTQTELLARKLDAALIKSGDIARQYAKTNTEVAHMLQNGELIDSTIMNQAIENTVLQPKCKPVIVFDGFPRERSQAVWLGKMLRENNVQLMMVFYLKITPQTALERLLGRKRADDKEAVIRHRLDVFEAATVPVVQYYGDHGLLVEVNGEGSIQEIHKTIMEDIL